MGKRPEALRQPEGVSTERNGGRPHFLLCLASIFYYMSGRSADLGGGQGSWVILFNMHKLTFAER